MAAKVGPGPHVSRGSSASQMEPDLESQDAVTRELRPGLYYAPRSPGWKLADLDWKFVFQSQHYGTIVWGVLIAVALALSHFLQHPNVRPFLNYDASISYVSDSGDSVPSAAAVLVPFAVLFINLVFYEFIVFRAQNRSATHAVATALHFFVDAAACFVTAVFITEVTKFSVGRLRPDFLQFCQPTGGLRGQPAALAFQSLSSPVNCAVDDSDGRKSFPSGHASSSAVTMVYSIVYSMWSGYFRFHDASFMGLNRTSGWRGGRRFLREIGHGFYLVWMIAQFAFFWAVGSTRIVDNKHSPSDVIAGWFLGTVIGLIYSIRAVATHKYLLLDLP